MNSDQPNPHIPRYPSYESARVFLALMSGKWRQTLLRLRDSIWDFTGTPQETRDWSEPEEWIPTILHGEERALAAYLWEKSEGRVNPRHLTGCWSLSTSYSLLTPDEHDVLHLSPLGRNFLDNPAGEGEQYLDYSEGLLHLLAIVAEHGPGKRADLLPRFMEFLTAHSRTQSQSAGGSMWYYRITNLVDRSLIQREGVTYQITKAGLAYLENVAHRLQNPGETVITARAVTDIRKLLLEQHSEVRKLLAQSLHSIDPYRLEQVIRALLEAMGYEKVEVTRRSGDGGVDVVGDIRVGITYVREVVQVKRQQGNIQRPTLDQLRGSLHRFKAIRGTIITTGRFSKGAQDAAFEIGAAPITLIDGVRLIDLLIEHEIGARKEQVVVLKFTPADFDVPDDAEPPSEVSG